MITKKKTGELDKVLGNLNPDKIQEYIDKNSDSIYKDELAFSDYMKDMDIRSFPWKNIQYREM